VLVVVLVVGWLVRRRLLRRAQRDGPTGVQAEV
jgi:hypothetical protein